MRDNKFWGMACAAAAALALCLSCAGSDSSAGSAILYVYDGTTKSVLSWNDVSALYDNGTATAADRTITSTRFTSSFILSPSGMALDAYNQYLYLVSTTGTVVRISRAAKQSGDVSSSDDVISFSFDDSNTDAVGGVFGQVAVDPTGSRLYVTECNSSNKSQIWVVPLAVMWDGAKFTKDTGIIVASTSGMATSETACTGVAASSTALYAYFESGGTINSGLTDYTASRLRMGSLAGAFPSNSSVIVGQSSNSTTMLGKYGSLAYDTGNDILYFARHNTDSGKSDSPVLAFKPGDFSPGLEYATPTRLTGPNDLRMIAHGGKKDWLVGAGNAATSTLWIWKAPSAGGTPLSMVLPDTSTGSVQILGLALDGSD